MNKIIFGVPTFVAWVVSLFSLASHAQNADSPTFHINSERLQATLEKLSEFGRNPEGGVTRLGFSETDLAARAYVMGLMKEAGLEVRIDLANISRISKTR
jgi:beta-ureidopropionase / N-carbamoyl-L-amino-acid hydrolase